MSFSAKHGEKARWSEGWEITKSEHNINISYDDKYDGKVLLAAADMNP